MGRGPGGGWVTRGVLGSNGGCLGSNVGWVGVVGPRGWVGR